MSTVFDPRNAVWAVVCLALLGLAACGGEGSDSTAAPIAVTTTDATTETTSETPARPAEETPEGVRTLAWANLVPETESFEDPFAALDPEHLRLLGLLVRVRTMEEMHPEKVSEGMKEEVAGYEKELRERGVDIEGLLARREEIRTKRAARASAVMGDLDGVEVRIPGYFLPLEHEGEKVIEFLLVPWVGACIHTPPPPPNQIVHVRLEEAIKAYGLFSPIWAHGVLSTQGTAKELFHVDGRAIVPTAYSMPRATATLYER